MPLDGEDIKGGFKNVRRIYSEYIQPDRSEPKPLSFSHLLIIYIFFLINFHSPLSKINSTMSGDNNNKQQKEGQGNKDTNQSKTDANQGISMIQEYQQKWGKIMQDTDRQLEQIRREFVPIAWESDVSYAGPGSEHFADTTALKQRKKPGRRPCATSSGGFGGSNSSSGDDHCPPCSD